MAKESKSKQESPSSQHQASDSPLQGNPFDGYSRHGKHLIAPFNAAMQPFEARGGEVCVSSWGDDRLPEFLWVALILEQVKGDGDYD